MIILTDSAKTAFAQYFADGQNMPVRIYPTSGGG